MDGKKLTSILLQINSLSKQALVEIGGTTSSNRANRDPAARAGKEQGSSDLSFATNLLAFMTKHAKGRSGTVKFTLLVARLLKGSLTAELPSREAVKEWNKMKSVLGGQFNPAHANRAKAQGWVDSPRHGVYKLAGPWKEVLEKDV